MTSTTERRDGGTGSVNPVFHRYYLGCLSHASYMIGDPGTGKAAVIDPRRDVD